VKQPGKLDTAIENTSVPAVVLNLATHCGVGVVRSLGRLGVPVYCVHSDPAAPSLRSRYSRRAFEWDIEQESLDASIDFLIDVSRDVGGRPILIPTEDVSCLFVDEHADALGRAYRFPRRPPGLAQTLSSKEGMYHLCRKLGIPTPSTSFPKGREDAEEFASTATFPVMMKGVDNRQFGDTPGAGKVIATSRENLLSAYEDMTRGRELRAVILQEYIPGDAPSVWMFNGYFDENSDCVLGVTGQKLRQYPPYIGQTSLGSCVDNPTVQELTRKFMKAVGYTGILDLGFRYDARDGHYKLLDVNPRVGSAFRLFLAQNGLDVVRALYLDMTGQRVPKAASTEGRKWVVENYDLVSSAKYFRDGALRPGEWVQSFRGVEESAWFSWDDLRPFGAMWTRSVRYALSELRSDASKRSWWGIGPPVEDGSRVPVSR
jgi:predicted ATP-grasp superfamily ATP-dependent carboligase